MRSPAVLTALLAALVLPNTASAFCGFYVAKADAALYNKASQVVLARSGNRTVLTMASDFQGDIDEFAVVVPVPTLLERDQIHVTERKVIEHLDAYTAPRLVEYFDENPCSRMALESMDRAAPMAQLGAASKSTGERRRQDLGVTIEAQYSVGEYDILILSAKQSDGLITWLQENRYQVPAGAKPVVESYLRQNMRFFVAKVNLKEQQRLGYAYLRPLQVAYESRRFMLPIRLGMVNAQGTQELYVYALTAKGRVETTNYRTVKLPTGSEVPTFVKAEFGDFYKSMFARQTAKEGGRAVFMEYAWDMAWCDPCAADPLSQAELRELGVFWLNGQPGNERVNKRRIMAPSPAQNVFVTRLHVSYDQEHFPEDLMFHETADRTNFQGRYVVRHAWTGNESCPAAEQYRQSLVQRYDREAQTLANLTGWDRNRIEGKMNYANLPASSGPTNKPWWQNLWND